MVTVLELAVDGLGLLSHVVTHEVGWSTVGCLA